MKVEEINEHKTPSGGWQFRQPETKWVAPTPIGSTLDQTAMLIIAMRKANPAITAKFKLATNFEAVKAEVLRFNRKRLGLPEESTPSPFQVSHSTSRSGAAGVVVDKVIDTIAGLKRAAQGTAVVMDWLISGGAPVAQELANKRAATCVECPKNQPGDWYTTAPATLIKETLESRKDLKLETPHDDKLQSCAVCRCLNRLKVWCPLEHIITRTKPEIMAEFPKGNCWIARRDA